MAEQLWSGATGLTLAEMRDPAWQARWAGSEPYVPTWQRVTTTSDGMQLRCDRAPGDVADPGLYELPERPPPGSPLEEVSAWARANSAGPNDKQYFIVRCVGCGGQGSLYCSRNELPAEPRCRGCAAA